VRGKVLQGECPQLPSRLAELPVNDLDGASLQAILAHGRSAGLRLHKFKRSAVLPRVQRVFGALRGIGPGEILDIGSGRGVFLWPLLHEFPGLPVTAIDQDERRARDLAAIRIGGIERLNARRADVTRLEAEDGEFDVVTMLEVLEHIPQFRQALAEVVRVARRFVILSVPSRPDDNPEHIHLFGENDLRRLFAELCVTRAKFDYVPGHLIAVVNVADRS
jgi:ubiquinone/menaquinone biosynthesis C-methylase UbiE